MKFRLLALILFAQTSSALGITDFSLAWMNHPHPNTTYRSSDVADGIFIIEAWFYGCPYCHENAPNVNELAVNFEDEPRVQVLDVGVDRLDDYYLQWISQHTPNHPVLKDYKQDLVRQFAVAGFPSAFIVSRNTIQYQTNGVWSLATMDKIRQVIRTLLRDSREEDFQLFELGTIPPH